MYDYRGFRCGVGVERGARLRLSVDEGITEVTNKLPVEFKVFRLTIDEDLLEKEIPRGVESVVVAGQGVRRFDFE